MTYSSGLPILYFIAFLSFIVTYWTDKILVLRFYRKTEGFTPELSKTAIKCLPTCLLLHALIGHLMFSSPRVLHSGDPTGSDSGRLGQPHVILFIIVSCVIILTVVYEDAVKACFRRISRSMREGLDEDQNISCDDIYAKMSFG